MKPLFLFFFMALMAAPSFSQDGDISIPENYLLKKPEHYVEYAPMVANCCRWLMDNKADYMPNRRGKAYQFVWDWVSGHPDITWNVNTKVVSMNKKNPELLLIFMAGLVFENIENEDATEFSSQMAGVTAMLDFYTKNRSSFGKDKLCEKMLKMKSNNTLSDYVKKNI